MYNFRLASKPDFSIPTITQAFPQPPWDEAYNRIKSFESASLSKKIEIADWCVQHCIPLSVVWGGDWTYVRARAFESDELPQNMSELIWPPKKIAKPGRANLRGEVIMYLAVREETALSEIRHLDGHAVTSYYKIMEPKGFKMIALGELTSIKRTGRGRFLQEHSDTFTDFLKACDYYEGQTMLLIDGFLTDVMAHHDVDYAVTARIVNGLLSRRTEAGAVAYPSVQHLGGMNLAINTNKFWESWGVSGISSAVYEGPGGGIYLPKTRQNVIQIEQNGDLKWGASEPEHRKILEFRTPFQEDPLSPLR